MDMLPRMSVFKFRAYCAVIGFRCIFCSVVTRFVVYLLVCTCSYLGKTLAFFAHRLMLSYLVRSSLI